MSTLHLKTLYIGDLAIGNAHSWQEASEIIAERGGPDYSGPELSRMGHESPEALFLPATTLTGRESQ